MSSLFHSSLLSNHLGKQGKEKNSEKDNQMSFGLLADFTLFYFILAVDAALTAETFLRSRLGAKGSTPAG
jgi:hypothetical protein